MAFPTKAKDRYAVDISPKGSWVAELIDSSGAYIATIANGTAGNVDVAEVRARRVIAADKIDRRKEAALLAFYDEHVDNDARAEEDEQAAYDKLSRSFTVKA